MNVLYMYMYMYVYDPCFQEYPHQLTVLKDSKRMEEFLANWESFDRLVSEEHSSLMLQYWQLVF